MTVAILCAARKSVYKSIPDVDVFDVERDARFFGGGMPVVAHPPCRHWSAFCRHQATQEGKQDEMDLGLWCVGQVMRWGGVLEQPAHSRLWSAANLPFPNRYGDSVLWSMEVPQYWFGDKREKNTWLLFSNITRSQIPELPFRLKAEGGDRRIWQLMSSKNQRERTPLAFAEWLVACARMTRITELSTV